MYSLAKSLLLDLYLDGNIQFKNLVEFSLLITGRKSVVRLVGNNGLLSKISRLGNALDMSVAKSPFMLDTVRVTSNGDRFQVAVPWFEGSGKEFVIYIGDTQSVAAAVEIESDDCNAEDTAEIYGYPSCCGKNYQLISDGQNWIQSLMNNSKRVVYDYRVNKIAGLFDPCLTLHQDYFPCSFDCEDSLTKCLASERALAECGLEEFIPYIEKHLSGIYLMSGNFLWFARQFHFDSLNGRFDRFSSIGYVEFPGIERSRIFPTSIELDGEKLKIIGNDSDIECVNGLNGTKLILFTKGSTKSNVPHLE